MYKILILILIVGLVCLNFATIDSLSANRNGTYKNILQFYEDIGCEPVKSSQHNISSMR